MPQTWNPETYGRNGAFVHELAGGVLEWLAPQPGERILDLGCGDGQLTLRIAASGASVVGIDASPAMVAAARARGVEADNGPAEKLPYPDHVFDAVFSNAVLHWVRGQDEMLSQVRRVLRPGGRFVAEMGGHGNIAAIRAAFAAVLARHGFASLGDRGNYYPTAEEYSSRLERQGFTVQKIAHFPRPTLLACKRHGRLVEHLFPRRSRFPARGIARSRRRRNRGPARTRFTRARRPMDRRLCAASIYRDNPIASNPGSPNLEPSGSSHTRSALSSQRQNTSGSSR